MTKSDSVGLSEPRSRSVGARELDQLQKVAQDPSIESAVGAVREFLGMEVAYMTTMDPSSQTFEVVDGDAESFGIAEGMTMDAGETYCQRVLAGRLPNLMPDVKGDPRTGAMPITEAADVGAFVSVPLTLSDGSVPGTLCAASHRASPSLGYRELQFLHVFARLIADQIERHALEEERLALEEDKRRLEQRAAAAHTLVAAVSARDNYTGEHSRNVVNRAVAVARHLGLSEETLPDIETVALLHDIGKIGVSDAVLNKPGPLTVEEWEAMRRHPLVSEQLIADIPGLQHLGPALRAEHERWDGGGYPDGLVAEQIPIASRVTLACDAYDAMTTDRPYRAALPRDVAREEIRAGAGSQFCPEVATALLAVLGTEDQQLRPS